MNADLSVIPQIAGDIEANIRITYEDVYGNQTEELLPLKMTVNEEMPTDGRLPRKRRKTCLPTNRTGGGIGWIFWVLGGITVAAGLQSCSSSGSRKNASVESGRPVSIRRKTRNWRNNEYYRHCCPRRF